MGALPERRIDSVAPANRSERRLIGRALGEWESLRGARPFPSCLEFDNAALPNDKGSVFVIEVGNAEPDDRIIRAGRRFIEALGLNPLNRPAIAVLPSAERRLSYCRTVVQFRRPVADIGRFTNTRGEDVWYRSILLPTSTDQSTVNYVVGAFSYKVVH